MTLLIFVLIVAFSVSYVTEVLGVLLQRLSFVNIVTNLLIPPLAFISLWLLDIRDVTLVLSTLAASFISTAIATGLRALSKPKVIQRNSVNRYY